MSGDAASQRRTALVLYGSETGNAQDVAEEVGAMVERLHFTTHVSELNHVKPVCYPAFLYICRILLIADPGGIEVVHNCYLFGVYYRPGRSAC